LFLIQRLLVAQGLRASWAFRKANHFEKRDELYCRSSVCIQRLVLATQGDWHQRASRNVVASMSIVAKWRSKSSMIVHFQRLVGRSRMDRLQERFARSVKCKCKMVSSPMVVFLSIQSLLLVAQPRIVSVVNWKQWRSNKISTIVHL
jgi:hypothetical protein